MKVKKKGTGSFRACLFLAEKERLKKRVGIIILRLYRSLLWKRRKTYGKIIGCGRHAEGFY